MQPVEARRASAPVPDARRRLIATAQMARKALAIETESWRALVKRISGHESSADCTDAQLQRLVDELKRLGFKPSPGKGTKPAPASAKVRAIYAVWADIRPHLDDAGEETLRGFVRRQTVSTFKPDGVDDPRFLTDAEANNVLDGLKGWRRNVLAKAAQEAGHGG